MIQVRFEEQSRSRLVLILQEPEDERRPDLDERSAAIDERAASLLFSILDRGQQRSPAPVRSDAMKPTPAPRRRKPRAPRALRH